MWKRKEMEGKEEGQKEGRRRTDRTERINPSSAGACSSHEQPVSPGPGVAQRLGSCSAGGSLMRCFSPQSFALTAPKQQYSIYCCHRQLRRLLHTRHKRFFETHTAQDSTLLRLLRQKHASCQTSIGCISHLQAFLLYRVRLKCVSTSTVFQFFLINITFYFMSLQWTHGILFNLSLMVQRCKHATQTHLLP